jgi:hypothetical protein
MSYKLINAAQARWQVVNAPHLVALVTCHLRSLPRTRFIRSDFPWPGECETPRCRSARQALVASARMLPASVNVKRNVRSTGLPGKPPEIRAGATVTSQRASRWRMVCVAAPH